MTATQPPRPANGAAHDQVATRHGQLDSAAHGSTFTADAIAASAAGTVASTVGLVAEQVDVEDVKTEAATADAALATPAAVTATAATTSAEHRQDGTGRQQLHVLTIDLSKAQCVRHKSS
ncbi:MAG TPA: hypothetical protein VN327_06295 [Pseudonocardiaceae bacterium]|nr:hypothetical protein [Pseudonocardiaceae bacterium]